MEVLNMINPKLIKFHFAGTTKEEIISKVVDAVNESGCLNDVEQYRKDVFIRESLESTGIGYGIAIPHAKSKGVSNSCFTLIKLKNKIEWQSLDGNPVEFVIMLAVPEEEKNEFLTILSSLATRLMDDDFRDSLLNSENQEEMLNAFKDFNNNID